MTLEERYQRLSEHRRAHSERVVAVILELAEAHQLDQEDARLAAWAHDLARELSRKELLKEAGRLQLEWGDFEERDPILLHGPIAAAWLKQAQRGSGSVWEAVRYHTTAAPDLDALGRALFVADGVEPARHYPERGQLLQLALKDLDAGYCAVVQHTLTYLQQRQLKPHPMMLRALKSCS